MGDRLARRETRCCRDLGYAQVWCTDRGPMLLRPSSTEHGSMLLAIAADPAVDERGTFAYPRCELALRKAGMGRSTWSYAGGAMIVDRKTRVPVLARGLLRT